MKYFDLIFQSVCAQYDCMPELVYEDMQGKHLEKLQSFKLASEFESYLVNFIEENY